LLDQAERKMFERLAVFAGGWTTAAAGDVADATPSDLAHLVERSLVTPQFGGDVRFFMLEPVRQFAEARLAERCEIEQARRRHATWVVDFAEAAGVGLCGPDEADWRAGLDTELDNLRAAHRWCLDHDGELSIRLIASLYRYTWSGAPSEVSRWAAQAVSRYSDFSHPLLPVAYAVAALGWCFRGDLAAARTLAQGALAEAPEDPVSARFAWEALGDIETWLGNFDRAMPLYDRAIELARLAGDDHQAAISLLDRAVCPSYSGRVHEAIAECDAAAPLVDAVRNPSLDAWSDYINGEVRLDQAPLEALPYLRRSVAAARRIGNRTIAGVAGLSAISCEARVGDPDQALSQYGELIDHWHREGAWNMQWTTLRTLVELLTRLGRDADAALLLGAMTASATASPLVGADAARIAEAVATMRARLGDERFEALRTRGAALPDSEAVAFALECVGRKSSGWPAQPAARTAN
jgi:tetratricopeptide (TPR) repeat protein